MGDIMVLAMGSIVAAVVRAIFVFLDTIVYNLLTGVYSLLTDIASINLFGSDGVGEFGTRIYTIIGVIMLFKLAFSILTYIIDPDKMTDNKNGFGTIVKDIIVMFILIVTVPLIFRTAMGLQYLILEDDTIGRLVTGHHGGQYDDVGNRLSTTILLTFIHPNERAFPDCAGVLSKDDESYQSCLSSLAPYSDVADDFRQIYEDEKWAKMHIFNLAMNTDKVSGYSDEFVITYNWLISTIVGIFTTYILLLFCIDIAVRTFKLAFLQLIAPIPIVAYMDEKGKNGIFKKWVDVCKSTYLDLFVRLAGIDFAIYLISEFIFNGHMRICHWKLEGTLLKSYKCTFPGLFAMLFMILGVLMFAKELPKLIEEITGLKLGGKFELNPMKKLSSVPIAGAALGAGLGYWDARHDGATKKEAMYAAWRGAKNVGIGGSEKKFDDLTPLRKKMMENRTKGITDFEQIDAQWVKGAQAKKKLLALGANQNNKTGFDRLDGKDVAAYQAVYTHDEFRQSIMKKDAQDAVNKKYTNILYEAQTMGSSWSGGSVTLADGTVKYYDQSNLSTLKEDAEKSQKTLTGLEKVHDTMRNKYQSDASTEDAIKINKYNEVNPTGRQHPGL